jgi:hypothetical protein
MAGLHIDHADFRTESPLYRELRLVVLHVVVALVGGVLAVLLVGGLFAALFSGLEVRPPTPDVIYNPFIWLPAFFLGLVVNRFARHRSAPFVGIVGLVLLVGVMAWDVSILRHGGNYRDLSPGHDWAYEFRQLFSADKTCRDSECLGKILVTAPFITTVAYSIGAWLGLRFGKIKDTTDQRTKFGAHTHA